jgi:phospholipase C
MTLIERRAFLRAIGGVAGTTTALCTFPPVIQRALAIPAHQRTGTLQDVEHVVILMQENRAFDHYYGTLNGVRGFADPFPIPAPDRPGLVGRTVWLQPNQLPGGQPPVLAPFRLDTEQHFELMRAAGTPHTWLDAQIAWNHGRLDAWPKIKANHALGHYAKGDLPFQWALVNAFTVCDAYHASLQTGTNPNRLFQWTGTNDPLGLGNGPATYNDYDSFDEDPGGHGGYSWTTYPERLQAAGISWQVYENMADNFGDNPLAGFQNFRAAWFQTPGYSPALRERGVSTRDLDLLREDVLAGRLPQVSWIVATAAGSEHPSPSSPAQGADYTSRVLEALTSNPEVWGRTVLFINFDENDGFFDHVPPPAPPSYRRWDADPAKAVLAGASTVDTAGEYHEVIVPYHDSAIERSLLHRPYGLGPRVPLVVVSPWSRGGWVNSQVFDHGSVLRFIERRFGVAEPNISPWRRGVCGDLTSAFNFADPNDSEFFSKLPATLELANRAAALRRKVLPRPPATTVLPVQSAGVRPARALPYELQVQASASRTGDEPLAGVRLAFANLGRQGAVLHVYDRRRLDELPRRYTVEPGKQVADGWPLLPDGGYDLWVLGPNGFHRHFTGNALRVRRRGQPIPEIAVAADPASRELVLRMANSGAAPCTFTLWANRYLELTGSYVVAARSESTVRLALQSTHGWYDFSVGVAGQAEFGRRFAGHLEDGAPSISDPAMYGPAVGTQSHAAAAP